MLDGLKFNLSRCPFCNNCQNFGYFNKLKFGLKISFANKGGGVAELVARPPMDPKVGGSNLGAY